MEKHSTSQRSPLSPTLWPADAFSLRRCAIFIAAVAGAFVIGLACAALALKTSRLGPLSTGKDLHLSAGLLVAQVIAYIPLLGAALPLLPFAARRTLSELGLRLPQGRHIVTALLGAIAMYVIAEAAALLQKFALHVEGTQQAVQLFGTTRNSALIAGLTILAVCFAPIVEELIFRGFVFNALLRYAPVGVAAVLSGMIFSLAHVDRAAFFPLACGGVVLAVVYYRTGSLVSSMVTHSTFNAVNVVLVLVTTGGKG